MKSFFCFIFAFVLTNLHAQLAPITSVQISSAQKIGEFPAENRFEGYMRTATHEFVHFQHRGWFERKITSSEKWEPVPFMKKAWQFDSTVYWVNFTRDTVSLPSGGFGTSINSRLYKSTNSSADSTLLRVVLDTVNTIFNEPCVVYHQLDKNVLYELIQGIGTKLSWSDDGGITFLPLINPKFSLINLPVKSGPKYYGFNQIGDSLLSSTSPIFSTHSSMPTPFGFGNIFFFNDSICLWDQSICNIRKFGSNSGQYFNLPSVYITSIQKHNDGKFYLVGSGGELFRSSSLGGPFQKLEPLIQLDGYAQTVKIPTNGWVMFRPGYGFQISTDYGSSWTEIPYRGLPVSGLFSLDIQSGNIYGNSTYTTYKYISDSTWTPLLNQNGSLLNSLIEPASNGAIMFTGGIQEPFNVLKTSDLENFTLCATLSTGISYARIIQKIFFTYTQPGFFKLYEIDNCDSLGAYTWFHSHRLVHAKKDTVLILEEPGNKMLLLINGGSQVLDIPFPSVNLFYSDKTFVSNDTIYLLGDHLELWYSTNFGRNWIQKFEPAPNTDIAVYRVRRGMVFCAFLKLDPNSGNYIFENGDFYLSKNPANGWIKWDGLEKPQIPNALVHNNTVYYSNENGVYKTYSAELQTALNNQYSSTQPDLYSNIQWQIVPNPATNSISLLGGGGNSKLAEVRIHDASSRLISIQAYRENETINLDRLTNGVYFITLIEENGHTSTKKFVKIQ